MADITITQDSKTTISITNQGKPSGDTVKWSEAVYTWEESRPSTWDVIRLPLARESKNSVTISNTSK